MSVDDQEEIKLSLRKTISRLDDTIKKTEKDDIIYGKLLDEKVALERHLQQLIMIKSSAEHPQKYSKNESKPKQVTDKKEEFNKLEFYIDRLKSNGKNADFLILILDDAKNYFFQFFLSDDESSIIVEASSNNVLEDHNKLTPEKVDLLTKEGWLESTDGSPNYQLIIPRLAAMDDLIEKIRRVAQKVYESPMEEEVQLSINFQ